MSSGTIDPNGQYSGQQVLLIIQEIAQQHADALGEVEAQRNTALTDLAKARAEANRVSRLNGLLEQQSAAGSAMRVSLENECAKLRQRLLELESDKTGSSEQQQTGAPAAPLN